MEKIMEKKLNNKSAETEKIKEKKPEKTHNKEKHKAELKSIDEFVVEIIEENEKSKNNTLIFKTEKTAEIQNQNSFYQQSTDLFNEFFRSYTAGKQESSTAETSYNYKISTETEKKIFSDDEVITYNEKKEIVRKTMLNSLLNAPHNNITFDEKQRYEMWKSMSKFNLLLSFIAYDSVFY